MAWNFTSLRYGWQIAASIVLAGTTIYVANNLRQRVNQADVIEIALGVTERCLATQTSTNPTYSVNPPSFVRSWYSNDYTTNGAILYTNVFTNVIGFRTDRAMLASLDTTIKALVPYYVDTNSVYDGTTNIVMLTVTGLWASLHIGDGTNKFTSEPAWVGTNGVTNAATYGDYPSRIYVTDLQERYKVLNALKIPKANISVKTSSTNTSKIGVGYYTTNFPHEMTVAEYEGIVAESKTLAETDFNNFGIETNTIAVHAWSTLSGIGGSTSGWSQATLSRGAQRTTISLVLNNTQAVAYFKSLSVDVVTTYGGGRSPNWLYYNGNGDFSIMGTNTVGQIIIAETNTLFVIIGNDSFPLPSWDGVPLYGVNYTFGGGYIVSSMQYNTIYTNSSSNIFSYCTNKYW